MLQGGFDADIEDLFFSSDYLRPVLSGPFFPPGTVMSPYSPIMTSLDRSYFAFLDIHCSFGVYKVRFTYYSIPLYVNINVYV